jgi:predicted DCC family thiol-disulfide oxidoreductase YuxK
MVSGESCDNADPAKLTVYFDGSCPLCSKEIGAYRKCRGGDEIDWVDVSRVPDHDLAPGLSRTDAIRRFHVRLADGTTVSGGAAFAELWAALPALAFVGYIGRCRPVSWILEVAYLAFLPIRPWLQRRLSAVLRNAQN